MAYGSGFSMVGVFLVGRQCWYLQESNATPVV